MSSLDEVVSPALDQAMVRLTYVKTPRQTKHIDIDMGYPIGSMELVYLPAFG